TPLGGGRAPSRGSGQAPVLRVGVPRGTHTGVYMVRLAARAGAARVPLAVRGGAARTRVLVALPAITWQGPNPVDDDAAAFPATELADPSPPQGTNVLGEETGAESSAAAPLVVNPGDTLGLFSGTDGFVGLFTRFEQSRRRVGGTQVVASAGRDPGHPAFIAYKLGSGLVVRAGTPQWSRMLSTDTEVAAV